MPPGSTAAAALRRVLCATDLSEHGNRAVPFAFAIAAPGGRVTLLHVLRVRPIPGPLVPHYDPEPRPGPEEQAEQERRSARQLGRLAPGGAGGVSHEVRVVRASDVTQAVLAEAERCGADAICLATHCRHGLQQLVLGSTARDVLQRSGRPVFLVPPRPV